VTGLLVDREDGIAIATFNRPTALNALDTATRLAMTEALAGLAADVSVLALVVTGAGERGYCAGQDIRESAALGPADGARWMESWRAYFAAVASFPKPIVHAINGVAAGAGFETVLMGDIRLAAPHARFIMAEVDIGLPAIVGGFLLKTHLGHSRMTELVLTGRSIAADEARRIGIVHEIVPASELLSAARKRARGLAEKPPVALRLTLCELRAGFRRGLSEAAAAAARYQSEAIATGEPQRAMAEFLARRRGTESAGERLHA
jgi:enoyl-CoA hydratase/carnithine racemase